MACGGNDMSDARIGEVIEEELKEVPSEDVPPLTPPAMKLKTEQEQKMMTQLCKMIRIVGDRVRDDNEFQDAIDEMACSSGSSWDRFKKVAETLFEHEITWQRIAVLFYVAGRLAVKMVEAGLPHSVRDIQTWTVRVFRTDLLEWIEECGGWINSFSELAVAYMQSVSIHRYGPVVYFITGLALGSVITLGLTTHTHWYQWIPHVFPALKLSPLQTKDHTSL